MSDPEKSDEAKRELSLLALGETLREPPRQTSKLMQALAEVRAEQDGVERHRLARSRRTARTGPLLAALDADAGTSRSAAPAAGAGAAVPAAPGDAMAPKPATASASPAGPAPRRAGSPPVAPVAPARTPLHDPRSDGPSAARRLVERSAQAARAVGRALTSDQQAPPRDPYTERSDVPLAPPPSAPTAPRSAAPGPPPAAVFASDAETDQQLAEEAQASAADSAWKPLIDPRKVIAGVRRSRNLILATTIIGALLGVAIAISTPKKYQASAELLADPRDLNLVDKELTQTGLSNEATLAIVENQVRILRSGTVLSQVIDRLNLSQDPEFNGTGKTGGLGGFIQAAKSLVSGGAGSDDPARRSAVTNDNLAKALDIERGGKTFVIVISATTLSGEKSALIANTMTEVFLQAYGQLQSNAAGRAADELTSKLDELRSSVEKAERKVETFKAENDIIDPQGRLITDDEIVKLNEQLSIARARTLELNARAGSMKAVNVDSVLSGVLPEELASATIQELRAQYSTLKSEADRLDVRLGPRHPQRQAVDSQLKGARDLINAELNRIVSSAQTELKRAVQLEQELSSRLAQLKVRQGSLSNEMVTLRELERDATAKRAVYEAFLLRARETGEQRGINSANMSVISKAFPPLNANPPSRTTMALTGLLLGFMAGVGLGVARGTYSSLADTANGGSPAFLRRRRRLGAESVSRFAVNPPREPVATAPDTERATAPQHPAMPQPAHSQTKPAAAPAPQRDTPMSDPIYAAYPNVQAAQAPHVPQAYPYAQAAQPLYPQPALHVAAYAQPYPPAAPQQMPLGYAQPYAPAPQHAPHMVAHPGYWQPHQPMPAPQPIYPYAPAGPLQAGMAPPQQPLYVQPPMQPFYAQAIQPGHDMRYGPSAAPVQPAPVQPAPVQPAVVHPAQSAAESSQIEEIRASLRECRDAIRDLTESRVRRRYF